MFYFSVQFYNSAANSSTFILQMKYWSEAGRGRSQVGVWEKLIGLAWIVLVLLSPKTVFEGLVFLPN